MTTFPTDVKLTYVAEGAANVIFSLQSSQRDYSRRLLRLRKATNSPITVKHQFDIQSRLILSNFTSSEMVKQELINLPTEIFQQAQDILHNCEVTGQRASKRHGLFLQEDETYCLLVEDMRSRNSDCFTFEFKPKWLLRSPNAPVEARRCRTCALRAMRASTKSRPIKEDKSFCPLGIVAGKQSIIEDFVDTKLESLSAAQASKTGYRQILSSYLRRPDTIILKLRDLQKKFDQHGILSIACEEDCSEDFLVSMALRDCVLFLRVNVISGEVEAKLADLDIKPATTKKFEHWRDTERELIDAEWYTPTEPDPVCFLSHCAKA